MKKVIFGVALLIGSFLVANPRPVLSDKPRFFVLPTKSLPQMEHVTGGRVIESNPILSLVQLNPEQANVMSQIAHKEYGVCGGFIDIEAYFENKSIRPDQVLNWATSQFQKRRASFDLKTLRYQNQVPTLMGKLNAERYMSYLTTLTKFPDRYARGEHGIKASEFLAKHAVDLAKQFNRSEISVSNIPTSSWYTQNSVVVRVPGKNSQLPAIVLGGHMDTYSDNKPGADDDGSGTSTVMELYTAILQSGMRFDRDIYFAYYAAEEWGLHGSAKVVAEFKKRNIPVRGVLQFDMTGFKSPKDPAGIFLYTDYVDQNLTQFLKLLAEQYVKVPVNYGKCGYGCSDHASWSNGDYPAGFPSEGSFKNTNQTLHTGNDKIELLNVDHIMHFVKLGAAFIVEAAEPVARH